MAYTTSISIDGWKVQDIHNLNSLLTQMSVLKQWFNKIVLKIQLKHISCIYILVFSKVSSVYIFYRFQSTLRSIVFQVPKAYKEELLITKSIYYLHSDLLNMNLKRKAFKFHGILGHVPFQNIWGCSLL